MLDDVRAPLERVAPFFTALALLYMAAFAGGVILVVESGLVGGDSRQFDFVAFWAAAKLALAGDALAAFDHAALRAAQALPPDAPEGNMYWFYPPGVQFLFLPFAPMPYWAGWLIFNLLAMTLFARALWEPARAVPIGHNLLIAAPIVIIVFRLGQLALLWSGVLVLALRAIAHGRPIVAGVLIALLSLKPQLGILIPIALLAGGHWSVILWAFLGAVAVHGLPTAVVGLEYWVAFFDQMRFAAVGMQGDFTRWDLMVSPYAFLRLLDSSHQAAMIVQYCVSALLAACIAWVWADRSCNFNIASAMLAVAIPIATPYAYYYELALCIPAAILLVRAHYGARVTDRILLALMVFGPASFWIRTELAPLFAPILLIMVVRLAVLASRASAMSPPTSSRGT